MVLGTLLEVFSIGLVLPLLSMFTGDGFVFENFPVFGVLSDMANSGSSSYQLVIIAAVVCVFLAKSVFLTYMLYQQSRFVFMNQLRLSTAMYRSYLHQKYVQFLNTNTATFLRNVTAEGNILTSSVVLPTIQIMSEAMVITGLALLLLVVEPFGTVALAGLFVLIGYLFKLVFQGRVIKWGNQRHQAEALRIKHAREGLEAITEVKIYCGENYFSSRFKESSLASISAIMKKNVLQQLPRVWLEFSMTIGLLLLILVAVLGGEEMSTVLPVVGLFAASAFRMAPSVNKIISAYQSIQYGLPALKVFEDYNSEDPDTASSKCEVPEFTDCLELRGVSFRYPDSVENALEDICFTINQGEIVGIIGRSGSGKSTLLSILLGLLEPHTGEVRIDGQLTSLHTKQWASRIGYVPQSIYLTDDTLQRNIAFGVEDEAVSQEAIQEAIELACLTEFLNSLPEGLATHAKERGSRLSGGQLQRLGLARALYRGPEILVLDEATNALDKDTESHILQTIEEIGENCTVIVISHNPNSLSFCDQLIRLDHGRVIAA